MIASRKDPSVLLRVPEPLLRRIDAAATKSGRSRNSEILVCLAGMFGGAGRKRSSTDITVTP